MTMATKNPRLPLIIVAIVLMVGLVMINGCGYGNALTLPSAATRRGTVSITIHWPVRSRLIPAAANSILITLTHGGQQVKKMVVPRPANGSASTASFSDIIADNITIKASAFPSTDGTGTAQGMTASVVIKVLPDTTTPVDLIMVSTVSQVNITPSGPSVPVAGTVDLAATAIDSRGSVVLTLGTNWRWASDNSAVATVTASGDQAKVIGVAAGQTTITALESESGKSTQVSVTVSTTASGGLANSPWPKFRGNAQNTGAGAPSNAVGAIRWVLSTGGFVYSSAAIGSDGTVYEGSGDGKLYAINGSSGAIKWTYNTGSSEVGTSPAIGANGIVYFGAGDGSLYAVDSTTGAKRWSYPTNGRLRSSPNIESDGTVVFGSYDGYVYALDGSNGQLKWRFNAGAVVYSSPAIGLDSTVYFGSESHYIYALNGATGALKWRYLTGDNVPASPMLFNDSVVVGSWDHNVYCLDRATGAKKWAFQGDFAMGSSAAIGPDGTVYVGSDGNKVYAINGSTGQKRWEFATNGTDGSSPAVVSNGVVYFGADNGGDFFAVDAGTGVQKWKLSIGSGIGASPAVGADGTIYFGATDGHIFAVK